ncbi:hypothetical protein [Hymenobacter negativus]|uniref:Lipocalin-like domain-containing protein n=1 Tax=Hymenobacter negativus TaxID=2795026 RepID=A0ABS0Q1C6_9BACT|nr:hypothetical protein [Hymenobacter negativus]MBH8556460.1 hypothetical protein [Hymenobacter negativus]
MPISLRRLTLALCAGGALGLTACKKHQEPAPDTRSQREIWLTTPGWSMQTIKDELTTPAGVVTTSTSTPASFFDPCHLDDLTRFNADRTFTVDDGPIKCPQPATSSTNTWSFAANETEILFSNATKSNKITTLTATTLALTYNETYPDGTMWTQTVTYAAK